MNVERPGAMVGKALRASLRNLDLILWAVETVQFPACLVQGSEGSHTNLPSDRTRLKLSSLLELPL